MTEQRILTVSERADIARRIRNMAQPVTDILALYRAYCVADMWARYDGKHLSADEWRKIDHLAEMYADLATATFEYELPALRVFFGTEQP